MTTELVKLIVPLNGGIPYEIMYDPTKEPGYAPYVETTDAVNSERERRMLAGKVFDGILVTGSPKDISNLTNLALAASIRINMGDVETITVFRDGNNEDFELTPPQVLGLWQKAAAYVEFLYRTSWAIKGMTPIPLDFREPMYWNEP